MAAPGRRRGPRPPEAPSRAAPAPPEATAEAAHAAPRQKEREGLTPLRRQYLDVKRRHPGMILLFQIGDFYETFDEDAALLARELGVTLTRKWFGKGDVRPLAGVPVRSLQVHLPRLLRRGHKIAICDQLTPPGRGLVERQVVRVITPGTVVEPGLLSERESNYLCALALDGDRAGLAAADVSTGEFRMTELPADEALAELCRLQPAELLAPASLRLDPQELLDLCPVSAVPDEAFALPAARRALLDHFGAATLAAYGCDERPVATRAAGAIVAYLQGSQPDALRGLTSLQSYRTDRALQLAPGAARDLDLFPPSPLLGGPPREPDRPPPLAVHLDRCCTPMGGRLLRSFLRHPLCDLPALRARQDAVTFFFERPALRGPLREALHAVGDIERTLGRLRRLLAAPGEVRALGAGLRAAARARELLQRGGGAAELAGLPDCEDIAAFLDSALGPPGRGPQSNGAVIRPGFSAELDGLRETLGGGRQFLAGLEARERARTGIKSLKVGYNKVFGYYIEVSRPNLRLVPPDYLRKQTVATGERYFTAELKEQEVLIAGARARIEELEAALLRRVCEEVGRHGERLRRLAAGLAAADVYAGLAELAAERGYCRPELHEGDELRVEAGRHPTLEPLCPPAAPFQPNDAYLSTKDCQIVILTAPNMAGKSVYLRQIALICLLGQIGSYVPARAARLPLCDRLFTRIGAVDDVQRGRSTFLSEMIEVAHLLHHATPRSLIILDEVGRGTATADGLAIARAVVEYLHNQPRVRAKTLFATHLHELTSCEAYLGRVRNLHLVVREEAGRLLYLHRVEPGRAERSFGVHVAQMAGLPAPLLRRAEELLAEGAQAPLPATPAGPAGPVASGEAALRAALLRLDANQLSPIEALTKLMELQALARG